jgi:hypothetical protein
MYAYGRGVAVDYAEAVRLLGPPTAQMQRNVRKYTPAQRLEIEAWMLALSLEMRRHSGALKRDFSEGAHVAIVLRAVGDAPRDAPPTQAAARTHATAHFDIDFRYKD